MKKINDLNLDEWKKYEDIWTDSLWLIENRDSSGAHKGDYHGNFVPQIPRQLMSRFTRKGDWVLDLFLGGGTTLIECKRLGRNGVGIELSPETAKIAEQRINQESLFDKDIKTEIIIGDSAAENTRKEVEKKLNGEAQLIIAHPPYHDIIKFSENPDDLSQMESVEKFIAKFAAIINSYADLLESGRHLAVVIGDKYSNSEWVPLSSMAMKAVIDSENFILKSVIVKDIVHNRAKRNQEKLWRYRALKGGYYIFKHEYILLFKKK